MLLLETAGSIRQTDRQSTESSKSPWRLEVCFVWFCPAGGCAPVSEDGSVVTNKAWGFSVGLLAALTASVCWMPTPLPSCTGLCLRMFLRLFLLSPEGYWCKVRKHDDFPSFSVGLFPSRVQHRSAPQQVTLGTI